MTIKEHMQELDIRIKDLAEKFDVVPITIKRKMNEFDARGYTSPKELNDLFKTWKESEQ